MSAGMIYIICACSVTILEVIVASVMVIGTLRLALGARRIRLFPLSPAQSIASNIRIYRAVTALLSGFLFGAIVVAVLFETFADRGSGPFWWNYMAATALMFSVAFEIGFAVTEAQTRRRIIESQPAEEPLPHLTAAN
jgi:cytochrome bd-type quinol oxidase subunit 1